MVLIAIGFYAYQEYHRTNKDITEVQEAYNVKAPDLLKEFALNDSIATKKYLGKIVAIQGAIKKIDRDENNYYTIVLGDSSDKSSIRCLMDSTHVEEVVNLQKGKVVTLKGSLTGFNPDNTGLLGSDVDLNRCVLKKD